MSFAGYDNFVVGGTGSGQRVHSPVRVSEGNFKGGGLVWPSRGRSNLYRFSIITP